MAKKIGLGILLPAQRGPTGYFTQGFDALTQIRSNLTNLILTKKGERIMQPTFGCDVHKILFENITDEVISNAKGTIQESAQIWLPFVMINDIKIKKDEDSNQIFILITFSLKSNVKITDSITLVI